MRSDGNVWRASLPYLFCLLALPIYFRHVRLTNKPQSSYVLFDLTEGESRGMVEIRKGDFFIRSNFGHLVVMLKTYVYVHVFAYYKALKTS